MRHDDITLSAYVNDLLPTNERLEVGVSAIRDSEIAGSLALLYSLIGCDEAARFMLTLAEASAPHEAVPPRTFNEWGNLLNNDDFAILDPSHDGKVVWNIREHLREMLHDIANLPEDCQRLASNGLGTKVECAFESLFASLDQRKELTWRLLLVKWMSEEFEKIALQRVDKTVLSLHSQFELHSVASTDEIGLATCLEHPAVALQQLARVRLLCRTWQQEEARIALLRLFGVSASQTSRLIEVSSEHVEFIRDLAVQFVVYGKQHEGVLSI